MKCTGCGTEFSEGRFCPECGTEVLKESKGVYNKLWNHPYFNKAAIVFNHFYDWLMLPASIGWICWMKEIESTWGIIIGVICLLAYLSNIISRFMKKSKFRKENSICPVCKAESQKSQFCSNCGSQMPEITPEALDDPNDNTPEKLNKKKKSMVRAAIILVVIILIYCNGGFYMVFQWPVVELKHATYKEFTKTLGEMIEDNFKNEKWTCEKIDNNSYYVYVRGCRMAAARMNPKTLQYIMGHSDISVTLNTYTHLGFEEASAEVNRIESEKKKSG